MVSVLHISLSTLTIPSNPKLCHFHHLSSSLPAFLDSIENLGTGAIELNAMHLKSLGALQARQLSYQSCTFDLVDVITDENFAAVYEQAAKIFVDLYDELVKSGAKKTEYWAGKLVM